MMGLMKVRGCAVLKDSEGDESCSQANSNSGCESCDLRVGDALALPDEQTTNDAF